MKKKKPRLTLVEDPLEDDEKWRTWVYTDLREILERLPVEGLSEFEAEMTRLKNMPEAERKQQEKAEAVARQQGRKKRFETRRFGKVRLIHSAAKS